MSNCNYEVKSIKYSDLKKEVKLPKFQRSIVWSKDARKALIDTIRKGYPFGTFLLFEISNPNFKYQLVDGLQRLSTIMNYEENKYDYLDIEAIAQEEFELLFEKIREKSQVLVSIDLNNKIKNSITSSFKNHGHDTEIVSNVYRDVIETCPILSTNTIMYDTMSIIEKINTKINNEIDLNTLLLPVLIFKGDESELPDMYDRINSNGTKLSKYEIFAALWAEKEFTINDDDILNRVEEKYSTMIDKSGITITDYTQGSILNSKRINLFEYAYSIGKIVRENAPEIFVDLNTDASKIDSIGFALLAVVLNGSSKNIDRLPNLIEHANSDGLINLKNKIVECANIANKKLKEFILALDDKVYSKYIESQIVSIIGSIFKIKYVVIDNPFSIPTRENSSKLLNKFNKNMPMHYLYDIIRGYWLGSGDAKATDILSNDIEQNKYIYPIDEANWRTVLQEWTKEQETKESKNVNIVQKLFLNYLRVLTPISNAHLSNYSFDVEHIVPFNRLVNALGKGCFSSIGNLCFLPSFENRSKKDKTLYEEIDEHTLVYNLDEEFLNKFYYAERSELSFVHNGGITKDTFAVFLKNRHNYLIKKFIELIK